MSAAAKAAAPIRAAERTVQAVPRRLRAILALDDFAEAARRHLPRPLFGYVSGAAERNAALVATQAAFADYAFVPQVLRDASRRDLSTELFGLRHAVPFGIAPMGLSALIAEDGDVVLAREAVAAGTIAVLSGTSLTALERVARDAGSRWFQAYLPGEADRIEAMLDRVARAGFDTFVLTVDVPVAGNRENNVRNGFDAPLRPSLRLAWQGAIHPRWLLGTALRTLRRRGMPHFENMDAFRGPPILSRHLVRAIGKRDQLSWDHVALMRRRWTGRLVMKGILSPADAARARDEGVDAIIVSNHGGRQLDGAVAPLRMLPGIVAEAREMAVMLDGGIRRGTDVLKAIALGARFVFVGRPMLFAAAIAGRAGVQHAIRLLAEEIDRDMALLGVRSLAEVGPCLLFPSARKMSGLS